MDKIQFGYQWDKLINSYPSAKKIPDLETAYEALKNYPADKMKSAVGKIIETEQYFPAIAVIIKNIKKCFRKNNFDVVPVNPGVGYMAGKAAENNQCMASWYSKDFGKYIICGASLDVENNKSPDPYLCLGHYKSKG